MPLVFALLRPAVNGHDNHFNIIISFLFKCTLFFIPFFSTVTSLFFQLHPYFFFIVIVITLSQCSPLRFWQIKPWIENQKVLNLYACFSIICCFPFHSTLFGLHRTRLRGNIQLFFLPSWMRDVLLYVLGRKSIYKVLDVRK